MEVKDKQRVVIEFISLEGRTGEEIVIRLQNEYGSVVYCRASVLRWVSEVRGKEELRNEECPEDG